MAGELSSRDLAAMVQIARYDQAPDPDHPLPIALLAARGRDLPAGGGAGTHDAGAAGLRPRVGLPRARPRHPHAAAPPPARRVRRQPAPHQGAESLTARQREILGLVSAGCTNRRIARRCGISERTVEKHLEAIFERLGVRSRTSAALRHQSTASDRLEPATPVLSQVGAPSSRPSETRLDLGADADTEKRHPSRAAPAPLTWTRLRPAVRGMLGP
jgi:DNA-binding CsgD family transcriptional regulator